MKPIFAVIITILLCPLLSCNNNDEKNKLLEGNWDGAEWLVNGDASARNVKETHFMFDGKGSYTFDYGSTKEEGTYKIENDMLFTTPKGQLEMMVKIAKLTNDSLVFDMSRGGQPETLTLTRKR